MADQQRSRDLSLVPYSARDQHGIILRHNNAVVVYDQKARQLVLRGTPPSKSLDLSHNDCPYCHRPFREEAPERDHVRRPSSTAGVEADFVSPEYFRMLQSYPPPPPPEDPERPPPSPQRRLARPIESVDLEGPPRTPRRSSSPLGPGTPVGSTPHGISAAALCPNYFSRFFVEDGVLGKGGKGVVLLVKHYLDGVFLGEFACKRVPVGDDHEWLKKVLVEVVLLQQLSHQNLVSYRHVWLEDAVLTKFGPSVPCAFILQQYCNAGDLLHYVCHPSATATAEQRKNLHRRRSKGQVDRKDDLTNIHGLLFDEIFSFFRDITSGLSYLHLKGFIHRDLKPSNCLLHKTGSDIRVLVSDFGEAQEANKARRSTGATGTISYCAPEVLREQSTDGRLGEFTDKSDIFSLGMILYFMCFGRLPYTNANNLHEEEEDIDLLRDEISAWRGFDHETRARTDLPEQLYRFLQRLLSDNPAERPSAEDIVRGISTGSGLGDALQTHPTNNLGSVFEDVRTSSRILPVETPPPGTPLGHRPGRSSNSTSSTTGFTRPGKSKLRPMTLSREPSDADPFTVAVSDEEDRSNASSLVLRKSFSSSVPPSPHRSPPPALPPPSPSVTEKIRRWTNDPHIHTVARIAILVLKVLTLHQFCTPYAVDPKIFYPLVSVAALDVAMGGLGHAISLGLTVLHFIVLLASYRAEVLCRSNASSGF